MSDQPIAFYRLGDEGVAVRSIRALLQATSDLAPSTTRGVEAVESRSRAL